MIKKVVYIVLMFVVLGALVPVLWPLFVGTDTDVQAMTETDDATVFLQTLWPIILIVVGLGFVAGLVFYALRKFKVMG